MNEEKNNRLINISQKTYLIALVMLTALIIVSIILTYIIPRGAFGSVMVGGEEVIDYNNYYALSDTPGIAIWKGLLAPILLLGSGDGLSVIMLSLFLLFIGGAFQAMSDCGGVKSIVNRIVRRFQNRRFLLLCIISLVFMLFGSLLGLFEEMLTLLPIMVILALSIGYDSFTGFLISLCSCGFGFATSITNPFTVLLASELIGVNPMINIWYRIVIFIVAYLLIVLWIYLYTKRISKDETKSYTYEHDQSLKENIEQETQIPHEKRILITYLSFFAIVLATIIIFSLNASLRGFTVVALSVVFLIFGLLASLIATGFDFKATLGSFGKGLLSVLPTIAFVLMASSVKYILEEGHILPTITHTINNLVGSENPFVIALILFSIVLVLEFFISSSTAKAIFVMSILGVINLGITKEALVLIYTFGDGYTNMLFPTSPVLLIGLSMIGVSYFKWLKKTWYIFLITFALVICFIALALVIHY